MGFALVYFYFGNLDSRNRLLEFTFNKLPLVRVLIQTGSILKAYYLSHAFLSLLWQDTCLFQGNCKFVTLLARMLLSTLKTVLETTEWTLDSIDYPSDELVVTAARTPVKRMLLRHLFQLLHIFGLHLCWARSNGTDFTSLELSLQFAETFFMKVVLTIGEGKCSVDPLSANRALKSLESFLVESLQPFRQCQAAPLLLVLPFKFLCPLPLLTFSLH